MKKQVKQLWVWPPGAGGNFVLAHYYGSGEVKSNNEWQVKGPVKWIPMFFNKIDAYHYLQIGYTIRQDVYNDNLQKLMNSPEENLSWHWLPIYLKDYLDINEINYILPKPEIQWFVNILITIKNRSVNAYDNFMQDMLNNTDEKVLLANYNKRIEEVNSFKTKNTNIIDYKQLFFEYDPELIQKYNLTTEEVRKYTETNVKLVEDFIEKNLSKEQQENYLLKLKALLGTRSSSG